MVVDVRRAEAGMGGGRGQREEEEEEGDAGRFLFKTRTQHHRMVGKNMACEAQIETDRSPAADVRPPPGPGRTGPARVTLARAPGPEIRRRVFFAASAPRGPETVPRAGLSS